MDNWRTPPELFGYLSEKYGPFSLDAAADSSNALCSHYLSKTRGDALRVPWNLDAVYCNPPYGRNLKDWIQKAHIESKGGRRICLLVPARTETNWFHEFVWNKAHLEFLRGRVRFLRPDGSQGDRAKHASMVVVYGFNN